MYMFEKCELVFPCVSCTSFYANFIIVEVLFASIKHKKPENQNECISITHYSQRVQLKCAYVLVIYTMALIHY